MKEYKRNRSSFWLKIFDEEPAISIVANQTTMELVQRAFPQLSANAPRGWRASATHHGIFTLWLPDDCYEDDDIEGLNAWASDLNQYLWLGINKNTAPFFDGSELDFCIAYDWNYSFDLNRRTEVGEAEYMLKYRNSRLTEESRHAYVHVLAHAVHACVRSLPADLTEYVVTTIPATRQNQGKLSWALANFVARNSRIPFVGVTLTRPKLQMKSLPLEQKIEVWRNIYSDPTYIEFPEGLRDQKILVVDDLFQSGASLFCFAEYLKRDLGARDIIAVTSVKAQKDGGNV